MTELKEGWSEELSEDDKKIMHVLGGLINDMKELMDFLTRNMEPRKAELCKIGYIETVIKHLGLDVKNESNQ